MISSRGPNSSTPARLLRSSHSRCGRRPHRQGPRASGPRPIVRRHRRSRGLHRRERSSLPCGAGAHQKEQAVIRTAGPCLRVSELRHAPSGERRHRDSRIAGCRPDPCTDAPRRPFCDEASTGSIASGRRALSWSGQPDEGDGDHACRERRGSLRAPALYRGPWTGRDDCRLEHTNRHPRGHRSGVAMLRDRPSCGVGTAPRAFAL